MRRQRASGDPARGGVVVPRGVVWWRGLGTVAVAVSMMLAALVLGCCDDTATASAEAGGQAVQVDRPAAPIADANARAAVRAVDDCVGGPESVSTVVSPSGASVHLPPRAADPISSDERPVSNVVTGVPGESGRYRLCVMRT
jgi:hypothetical protein